MAISMSSSKSRQLTSGRRAVQFGEPGPLNLVGDRAGPPRQVGLVVRISAG